MSSDAVRADSAQKSPGLRFRQAVDAEKPLQLVGTINANHALLAKQAGFKAIYLSGGGVAAGSLALPDLGLSNLNDILVDVCRITDVCDLPMLVDADTGLGPSALNIARTTKSLIKFGAAGLHIEDQITAKRCGHRPNKEIVSADEMVNRLKAVLDARTEAHFVVIARTDALAVEGPERAIERAVAYAEAGADMIFPDAVADLATYTRFAKATKLPILANLTEFGVTPIFPIDELKNAGVRLVLYPLSAFRAMNKAAAAVYAAIRLSGNQADVLDMMQTRRELYDSIGYDAFEEKLNKISAKHK